MNVETIRDQRAVSFKISGAIGRVTLTGTTLPVFEGIDDTEEYELARAITQTIRRADGSGKSIPFATRRQLEESVRAAILAELI